MATSIWGLLKESLTSSKLIREAIADMIADHDNDPTSHLGETGSLQSHKASEIIDHEAGSILADKLSAIQNQLVTTFNSYDQFSTRDSGGFSEIVGPELKLSSNFHTNYYATVFSGSDVDTLLDFSKNPFWQTALYLSTFSNCEAFFCFGSPDSDDSQSAFGFHVHGGKLYGFVFDGSNFTEVEITGVTPAQMNVYRAYVVSSEKKCYFLVNGVAECSVSFASFPVSAFVTYYYFIKGLTTAEVSIYARNVLISLN